MACAMGKQQARCLSRRLAPAARASALTVLKALLVLAAIGGPSIMAWGEPPVATTDSARDALLAERQRLAAEVEKLSREGKAAEAIAAAGRTLQVELKLFGAGHPAVADTLGWLARAQASQGNLAEAISLGTQAVDARRLLHGKEAPEYLTALNDLAEFFQARGDYARAEPLLREVLQTRGRVQGERHPDYGIALNNLAGLYQSTGDCAQAGPLLRRAVDLSGELLGPKHPDHATAINNLAGLCYQQGDYGQARRLFEQALAIRKEVLGTSDPDYATSLNNLAALYEATGDLARAEDLYSQALDVRKRVLGVRHPACAASLNNLASVRRAKGDFAASEKLFRQALELRRESLGPAHPDCAASLNNLAALYRTQGAYARAEPLYEQALAIQERLLLETFAVLSERQQLAMIRSLRRTLDGYLSVTAALGAQAEAAYGHVLAWKGMVFARQRRTRMIAEHPELAPLLTQLQQVSVRLSSLVFAPPVAGQEEERRRQLTECFREKGRLEAELSSRAAASGSPSARTTPSRLRAALPVGTMLVDFLEYSRSVASPGPNTAMESLTAFVVQRDRAVVRIELGPTQPIQAAVDTWRRTCGGAGPGTEAGLELRRRLWSPLEKHLDDAAILLVSPDGNLARFPLAALPGRTPGSYLIEERSLALVAVPQSLPDLLASGRSASARDAPSLLLVGDVDYDADGALGKGQKLAAPATSRRPHFERLEDSRGEILSARDSFEAAFPDGRVKLLRGRQATETAFRREAPQHRFLHLATHGFFAPVEHHALLCPDIESGAGPAARSPLPRLDVVRLHPGLLSGLVWAGANGPARPEGDDGILTAEEVASLPLDHVDLAVLSACETGLGAVAGGEGVLGLQRAMQMAGARSVVASLWKVGDEETRALMERFYEKLWTARTSKLEALRQAQLAMLRAGPKRGMALVTQGPTAASPQRAPPHAWAAFVLSGDWR